MSHLLLVLFKGFSQKDSFVGFAKIVMSGLKFVPKYCAAILKILFELHQIYIVVLITLVASVICMDYTSITTIRSTIIHVKHSLK